MSAVGHQEGFVASMVPLFENFLLNSHRSEPRVHVCQEQMFNLFRIFFLRFVAGCVLPKDW